MEKHAQHLIVGGRKEGRGEIECGKKEVNQFVDI
jgi:hypothetical protein